VSTAIGSALYAPVPRLGVTTIEDWYCSPTVLAAEQARIFARSWSIVTDLACVVEPGAYATSVIGEVPLAIVRRGDGTLRAFRNACEKTGASPLSGSGTTSGVRTSTGDACRFRREGACADLPAPGALFAVRDTGDASCLAPAAVGSWAGMIFARPTTDGPPLGEGIGRLDGALREFTSGPLVEVASERVELPCNWKLLVEHHIDVDRGRTSAPALAAYDHRNLRWNTLGGNVWTFEPLRDRATAPTTLRFLGDEARSGIGIHLIFPNVMIVTTGEFVGVCVATPVHPGATSCTLRVRSLDGEDGPGLLEKFRALLHPAFDPATPPERAVLPSRSAIDHLDEADAPIRHFHAACLRDLDL
jgi:phenylpropionate dioxygenase-like ring-hydroxylating dioxygenase large terminal subunit